MLILAGVALHFTLGENGILRNAEISVEKYEEANAREKLQTTLAYLAIEKETNKEYNSGEFLEQIIKDKDMKISDNMVAVDNYNFLIDREKLEVIFAIGQGNKNQDIEINILELVLDNNYVFTTIKAQINCKDNLSEVTVGEMRAKIKEEEKGIYSVNEEIRENGNYIILAKDEKGNYNFKTVEVTELTENMEISSKEGMDLFKAKVNEGRTFEGRTVKITQNIDLEGSKENQWTPLKEFAGTLDGGYYSIKNLYIYNNNNPNNGLFEIIKEKGRVEKVILENCNISNTMYATEGIYTGGIAAKNYGIISQCKIEENSSLIGEQTYLSNNVVIGGIVGQNSNEIIECVNKATITGNQNTNNCEVFIGGIAGTAGEGKIEYCYNIGEINSNISGICYIGGILGSSWNRNDLINCYNAGIINNKGGYYTKHVASIIGSKDINANVLIENNYHLNNMTYAYYIVSGWNHTPVQIGSMEEKDMKSDILIQNLNNNNRDIFVKNTNGYPLLKWEVEKH